LTPFTRFSEDLLLVFYSFPNTGQTGESMSKEIATLLLLAALALTISPQIQAAQPIVRKPPPPDYFPMRWKYLWKYKTKTAEGKETAFSIYNIHDDKQSDGAIWHELQTETSPTMKFDDWYSKSDGQVMDHHTEYEANCLKADYLPPRVILKHPLTDTLSWQWAGKGMMGVDMVENYNVSGPEEIVVPAGKFKAMKVVCEVTQNGAKANKTYWYGPNIGLVKSITESGPVKSTTELVSYDFPKLQPGELEAEINRKK